MLKKLLKIGVIGGFGFICGGYWFVWKLMTFPENVFTDVVNYMGTINNAVNRVNKKNVKENEIKAE